ncbi:MAG TPA: nuclear transport factor 2 family protein [Novosphingobium sp.]|nr:nuclear transport factor 2 family protein [Novosphingobium sp.]
MKRAAALASASALAACDPPNALNGDPIPPARCRAGAGTSEFVATSFYRRALIDKQVRAGFEGFVDPGFIEHKSDIASGDREGAIRFLEGLVTELPEARWEILRVVSNRNLVAIHARFTPAPGAPSYAIADFFRVADCRIVEHWDVVAPPPRDAPNPQPRF